MSGNLWDWIHSIKACLLHAMASLKFGMKDACSHCLRNKICGHGKSVRPDMTPDDLFLTFSPANHYSQNSVSNFKIKLRVSILISCSKLYRLEKKKIRMFVPLA